ncbi:hypothetical protein ACHQM5_018356 [Ranunculus cassubicifolius]
MVLILTTILSRPERAKELLFRQYTTNMNVYFSRVRNLNECVIDKAFLHRFHPNLMKFLRWLTAAIVERRNQGLGTRGLVTENNFMFQNSKFSNPTFVNQQDRGRQTLKSDLRDIGNVIRLMMLTSGLQEADFGADTKSFMAELDRPNPSGRETFIVHHCALWDSTISKWVMDQFIAHVQRYANVRNSFQSHCAHFYPDFNWELYIPLSHSNILRKIYNGHHISYVHDFAELPLYFRNAYAHYMDHDENLNPSDVDDLFYAAFPSLTNMFCRILETMGILNLFFYAGTN